jgi:sulfate adenylyltransferase
VAEGTAAAPAMPRRHLDADLLADVSLLLEGVHLDLPGAIQPTADGAVLISAEVFGEQLPEVTAARGAILCDDEATPIALFRFRGHLDGRLAGALTPLGEATLTAVTAFVRAADQVRTLAGPGRPVLATVTERPLLTAQIDQLREAGSRINGSVLILAAVQGSRPAVPDDVLLPALQAGAALIPDATVVAVPLSLQRRAVLVASAALAAALAEQFGATHVLARAGAAGIALTEVDAPAVPAPSWEQVLRLLDDAARLPSEVCPPAVAAVLRRWRPPRASRGLTVLFTGLSGSGKSTIAAALAAAITTRWRRRVTLLDGDRVRRLLSAGLGFTRADRDLNVRRIGFVAAEVSRHGGIAIAAPIAPYASSRDWVRRQVEEVGDFILVWVATPLEVCEARDRKGLYAAARAGIVSQFTGISDPYQEPDAADLVLDTSRCSVEECVADVLSRLVDGGWLPASG